MHIIQYFVLANAPPYTYLQEKFRRSHMPKALKELQIVDQCFLSSSSLFLIAGWDVRKFEPDFPQVHCIHSYAVKTLKCHMLEVQKRFWTVDCCYHTHQVYLFGWANLEHWIVWILCFLGSLHTLVGGKNLQLSHGSGPNEFQKVYRCCHPHQVYSWWRMFPRWDAGWFEAYVFGSLHLSCTSCCEAFSLNYMYWLASYIRMEEDYFY